MKILKEQDGISLVEVENKYHVVYISNKEYKVYSIRNKYGTSMAKLSDWGIKYVSNGTTKQTALKKYKQYVSMYCV
jgi:hypothetical protein